MTMRQADQDTLDRDGFVILPDVLDSDLVNGVHQRIEQLFVEEGDRAGAEFKQEEGCRRLANLVNKGEVFLHAIGVPEILEYVRHILGEKFKLSSLNARSVNPDSTVMQPLHCDMGAVYDDHGPWVANVVWILDDFTPHNGALRIVPGSHHWRKLPQDVLPDPWAPHPDEILVTGKRGAVVVMNAHLWHGGMPNRTDQPRTALHAFFCRWDKPQQQYQKQMLDTQLCRQLNTELRNLLALDDPLNDQVSSQDVRRSGFLK